MWRRLRAPVVGGVVVLCSLAIGASAGASSGSDRAATASHPNALLRAMTPAQRAAVSPHLAFARPGATFHASANSGLAGDVASCPWLNTSLPINQRVSMLMAKMTLADKLDLMEGHNGDAPNGAIGDTHAIPELCVPEVTQEDGPAGVADGVSGATQLPAPVNDAATWDCRRPGSTDRCSATRSGPRATWWSTPRRSTSTAIRGGAATSSRSARTRS